MSSAWKPAICFMALQLVTLASAAAQTPEAHVERPYKLTVSGLDSRQDGEIVQQGRGAAVSGIGLLVASDNLASLSKNSIRVGEQQFTIGAGTLFCSKTNKPTTAQVFAVGEPITVTSRPGSKLAWSVKKGLVLVPTVSMGVSGFGRREPVVDYLCPGDHTGKFPVSDAEVRTEYNRQRADAAEYHTRSILLQTEAEANEVIAKLRAGGSFEELAKLSKNTLSRDKGGDDGFHRAALNVYQQIVDATLRLKPGTFTDQPISIPTGWVVLRVDEVRSNFRPFAPMKAEIRLQLAQARFEEDVRKQLTSR